MFFFRDYANDKLVQESVEVQTSNIKRNGQEILINQCAAVLRQGTDLIEKMSDALFSIGGKSSIGTHFRHNLDFASGFLNALETGKLDYAARERNSQIENDRRIAVLRFDETIRRLESLTSDDLRRLILVRSETVADLWCVSSAVRELEFLQSHTIHHYALIRSKLSIFGFDVPKEFGVAPSTLGYWKSQTA